MFETACFLQRFLEVRLILSLYIYLNSISVTVFEQDEQLVQNASNENGNFGLAAVSLGYHFRQLLAGVDVEIFDIVSICEDDPLQHNVVNVGFFHIVYNTLIQHNIAPRDLIRSLDAQGSVVQQLYFKVTAQLQCLLSIFMRFKIQFLFGVNDLTQDGHYIGESQSQKIYFLLRQISLAKNKAQHGERPGLYLETIVL